MQLHHSTFQTFHTGFKSKDDMLIDWDAGVVGQLVVIFGFLAIVEEGQLIRWHTLICHQLKQVKNPCSFHINTEDQRRGFVRDDLDEGFELNNLVVGRLFFFWILFI